MTRQSALLVAAATVVALGALAHAQAGDSAAAKERSADMPGSWVYFESKETRDGRAPQLVVQLDAGKHVIPVFQDSVIISYLADRAWGRLPALAISMNDTNRSLLAFRLGGLREQGRLVKAEVVLDMKLSKMPPVEAFDLAVHVVTSEWDERTTCWASQPTHGAKPASEAKVEPKAGTIRLDVTEIVKQWRAGTEPNYGILLKVAVPIAGGRHTTPPRGDGKVPSLAVPYEEEQREKLPWPHQEPGLDAEQIRRLNEEVWVINDFPLYQADREGKRRYFHSGLDIVLQNGTRIYAMKEGWVKSTRFSTITICDAEGDEPCYGWEYTHLAEFQVKVGDFAKKGTWIGEVRFHGLPHIHLSRVFSEGEHWGAWRYLCCPNGHFTYTDDGPPVIKKPFHFFENGTDTLIEPSASGEVVLSGDVDIVAGMREAGLYARSNKTGFGDRLAVTKIDYEIRPVSARAATTHRYHSFDFRNIKIKCGVYAREHNTNLTKVVFKHWTRFESQRRSGSRTFNYYVITNCLGEESPTELKLSDREHCWRTGAVDEAGKPVFPDGEYEIAVAASDFVGNSATETMRVRVVNRGKTK